MVDFAGRRIAIAAQLELEPGRRRTPAVAAVELGLAVPGFVEAAAVVAERPVAVLAASVAALGPIVSLPAFPSVLADETNHPELRCKLSLHARSIRDFHQSRCISFP